MPEIRKATKYAIYNRKELDKSQKCGCYFCLNIYDPKEIKEWVDKKTTALCPYCEIDSVLPETAGYELTKEKLKEISEVLFKGAKSKGH